MHLVGNVLGHCTIIGNFAEKWYFCMAASTVYTTAERTETGMYSMKCHVKIYIMQAICSASSTYTFKKVCSSVRLQLTSADLLSCFSYFFKFIFKRESKLTLNLV